MRIKRIRQNSILLFICTALVAVVILSEPTLAQKTRVLKDGNSIQKAERLLSERGYWILKIDRTSDTSTYHAITAFQKVEGRKRTGRLTVADLEAIENSVRPVPAYIGSAHIEVDLTRQVLFLVDENDIVTRILPVSTGNGKAYFQNGKRQIANTPRGMFKITRQIKGIRRAPLGTLYYPNYFHYGFAIHGSGSIPFYPASHGCVRIPRFASKEFSNLVTVGMTVVLFDEAPKVAQTIEKEIETRSMIKGSGETGSCTL
jgi:hypothetical protein